MLNQPENEILLSVHDIESVGIEDSSNGLCTHITHSNGVHEFIFQGVKNEELHFDPKIKINNSLSSNDCPTMDTTIAVTPIGYPETKDLNGSHVLPSNPNTQYDEMKHGYFDRERMHRDVLLYKLTVLAQDGFQFDIELYTWVVGKLPNAKIYFLGKLGGDELFQEIKEAIRAFLIN